MNKYRIILLIILVPLLSGCGGDTLATWALRVEVRDAYTGEPAVWNATVTASDGDFAETIRFAEKYGVSEPDPTGEPVVYLAENRPGTYDVTITHPEYQTWHRAGIRVRVQEGGFRNPIGGKRFPEQVHILAELVPLDVTVP